MSKEFQPSIAGAQATSATPIVHRAYPDGAKGIEISLDDVAARIRKGRLDPRVRSWAIRTIREAGDPQGAVPKAQALLNGLRKAAIYVQDPVNAEYIQAAHETLCLDDKGFCFRGGDCFPKGTLVQRADGKEVAIEDIAVGDVIWGWNAWTKVTATVDKGELPVSEIHVARDKQRSIPLTKNHHVFIVQEGAQKRVRVQNLIPGNILLEPSDRTSCTVVLDVALDLRTEHCYDIQTEDHYVYLPAYDVTVSNCDDLTVAFGSASASVGIPTYVVGQAFNGKPLPSHVLAAIEDPVDSKQYRVDPSSKFDVGGYNFASKEWWIDPLKDKGVSLAGGASAETMSAADFVGVGWAGVGAADPNTVTGIAYNAAVTQLQTLYQAITDANISLSTAVDQVENARTLLRPDMPYDPEPAGGAIQSLADFPSDDGIWTASMSHICRELVTTGTIFANAIQDALSGLRTIYVATTGDDVGVGSTPADKQFYQIVVKGTTDSIIGVFVPGGAAGVSLLSGILTKLGNLLTPAQVQAAEAAQTAGTPTGVSAAPIVVAAWVLGAAIMTASVAWAFVNFEKTAAIKAQAATEQARIAFAANSMATGQLTGPQATAYLNQQRDFDVLAKQADAEAAKNDPFASTIKSVGTIVMWVVIGGGVALVATAAMPFLRELGEDFASSRQAKRLTAHPKSEG